MLEGVNQGNIKKQGQQYFARTFQLTIVSNAVTVDWNNGNRQYLSLPNGSTTTVTFANPAPGAMLTLIVKHVGATDILTLPNSSVIHWMSGGTAPTPSQGTGKIDALGFWYNDVDAIYLGSFQLY